MLVIDRMSILICYKIIIGPMRFFLPGAHNMLKQALGMKLRDILNMLLIIIP